MSYRELIVIDIKEMLRRRARGQSERAVARETGFDRKTVGRYFAAAKELSLPSDRAPTDEELHAVAELVQARPVADPSEEWQQVAAHRGRVVGWLALKRPLKLRKIHTLLKRDHGLTASYDTLRRFAIEELGWRKKPTTDASGGSAHSPPPRAPPVTTSRLFVVRGRWARCTTCAPQRGIRRPKRGGAGPDRLHRLLHLRRDRLCQRPEMRGAVRRRSCRSINARRARPAAWAEVEGGAVPHDRRGRILGGRTCVGAELRGRLRASTQAVRVAPLVLEVDAGVTGRLACCHRMLG
jgi:hypothetical protein